MDHPNIVKVYEFHEDDRYLYLITELWTGGELVDYLVHGRKLSEKLIIGIIEVVKEHYPDPTDKTGRFVVTDVRAKRKLKRAVSLEEIKSTPKLSNMALIKQSRLSVMPLTKNEWETIIKVSEK